MSRLRTGWILVGYLLFLLLSGCYSCFEGRYSQDRSLFMTVYRSDYILSQTGLEQDSQQPPTPDLVCINVLGCDELGAAV